MKRLNYSAKLQPKILFPDFGDSDRVEELGSVGDLFLTQQEYNQRNFYMEWDCRKLRK
jgi:hypothetical protein